MAIHPTGPGGEAGPDAERRVTSRNLFWAWVIGLILLGALIWGVGRLAAGIAPDYRTSGIDTGAGGTRDVNGPGGLPTPAGTALPPLPPPRTISTDRTYRDSGAVMPAASGTTASQR
jgi:hypothetical protein